MNKLSTVQAPAPWFCPTGPLATNRVIRRAVARVFGRRDSDTLTEISQLIWTLLLASDVKELRNPNGWVYEVARREAIREARKRRASQSQFTALGDEIADIADCIEDDPEEEERWFLFFKSLQRVDRSFVTAALRGESVEAIARSLGVSRAEGYRMRGRIREVYLRVRRGTEPNKRRSRGRRSTR
jgi:DNA-directed RNA polymerase specialized sigma24 family protein